jgi:hypothetical protein
VARSTQQPIRYLVRPKPNDVFQAARQPFGPGSTIVPGRSRPTWRSFGARSSGTSEKRAR